MQTFHAFFGRFHPVSQRSVLVPLPFPFVVTGVDLLQLVHNVIDFDRHIRHIIVLRQLRRVLLLLVPHDAVLVPPVVGGLLFQIQRFQLLFNAQRVQQHFCFVRVIHGKEFRQVQRQFFDKAVQECLSCFLPGGIGHRQTGILAFSLHGEPVLQLQTDPGWRHPALPLQVGGTVLFAPQGVHNGVQHGRLPLGVLSANHGHAGG